MSLNRLSRIEIGVPERALEATRGFYRDFGLAEVAPGHFATSDDGDQLALVAASRRCLRALRVGVDDADDLGRAAAALARLDVAAEQSDGALAATEPATGIRVTLAVEPRLVQKAEPQLPTNGPGRAQRVDARSPAVVVAGGKPRPHKLSHVVTTSPDATASRRFFVEGLGFRVSDEISGLGACFMRCSTDHHNVLVRGGPGAFVHHTAWEMDDVDAVGGAAAAWWPPSPPRHVWGLGRHAMGSNYFLVPARPGRQLRRVHERSRRDRRRRSLEGGVVRARARPGCVGTSGAARVPRARRHRGLRARGILMGLPASAEVRGLRDVAIVGYGPVGQVLAILLGQRGWRLPVQELRELERDLRVGVPELADGACGAPGSAAG
jgi:catechol 2,3-dioxygenase-like lactoylglutathione lyase family enzyme